MQPRNDVLLETEADDASGHHEVADAPHPLNQRVFVQAEGPFVEYRRTVGANGESVDEEITYRLDIPWFGWLFRRLIHRQLMRSVLESSRHSWWSPPDRLDSRQVLLLGLLAAASLSATFTNTLFTQTSTFAADTFGVDQSGLGRGGVAVRLGIVFALPFTIFADRVGRRKMLVAASWLAPTICALGALAPTFPILVATQAVGRPIGIAMAVLIGIVVTEEMPRNSRAYALSLMALSGGLGASVAVGNLWLADLGDNGWRLIYVLALVWLIVAFSLTRRLPETRRFEATQDRISTGSTQPRIRWRRFLLIASVAVLANVFVAPASYFQNNYLEDVRGLSGFGITLFTFGTATPASVGLLVGGRLADSIGRRQLLAICLPTSSLLLVWSFSVGGPMMWLTALVGGFVAGLAYPAFIVYRGELFPTGNRSRANGFVTALSLAGSSAGLLLVGELVSRNWSYGTAMMVVATGQILAALIAFCFYPETAHMDLESLNPEDQTVAGLV